MWGTEHKGRRFPVPILLAAGLFLLFDSAVLGLNYWITWQVEKDAIAINLAGRQRMLSQRMTKALLEMRRAGADRGVRADYLQELRLSFRLFDSTLNAFIAGGRVTGGAGQPVTLERVRDREARAITTRAAAIWTQYSDHIKTILQAGSEIDRVTLDSAIGFASRHNRELLDLMNLLTSRVERLSKDKTTRLRFLQTIAFTLALLNFIVIVRLFLDQLRAVRTAHTRLNTVIDNIGASVLVVDEAGRISMSNSTAGRLFAYPDDGLSGLPLDTLITTDESGSTGWRGDGTSFVASSIEGDVTFDGHPLRLISVFDITRQRETEDLLRRMAHYDQLTGLPNRALLEDRLQRAIASARRNGKSLAVLFLDLGGFKTINDTRGHGVGDEVLRQVARRLRSCVREVDTVSRFGGDEFVVVLEDIPSPSDCLLVTEKIIRSITAGCVIEDIELTLGISVGISLFPGNSTDMQELLRQADSAMYRAKTRGGSRAMFYSPVEIATVGLSRRAGAGTKNLEAVAKFSAAALSPESGVTPSRRIIPVAGWPRRDR
jgi:diguanylate cyclase (GGDEF)-like protein